MKKREKIPGKSRKFLIHPIKNRKAKIELPEDGSVPRITNETLAQHREEVLTGARRFIYPLQHSKHKIVIISSILSVLSIIGFLSYCLLSLYRFNDTSVFMYRVTQALPFPVARVGGDFVSYEEYLFELRHYIHYFEEQQSVDFSTKEGQQQLSEQRKRALDTVINNAFVNSIAEERVISVSDDEVTAQIDLLRRQNRLGATDEVLADVLQDYWGWTIEDFRRSIKQELLTIKVLQSLDDETKPKAEEALAKIKAGTDFAAVAQEYSNDELTKASGGEFGFLIDKNDRNIPAQTADALFELKAGEVSGLVDIGYGIEILKVIEVSGDKIKAAHIQFNRPSIDTFINELKADKKVRSYIKL